MGGSMGGLVQGRTQGLIALPGLARMTLTRTFIIAGSHPRPSRQMVRAGKAAHIRANFRDNDLSSGPPDPRDRIQQNHRFRKRAAVVLNFLVEVGNRFIQAVDLA